MSTILDRFPSDLNLVGEPVCDPSDATQVGSLTIPDDVAHNAIVEADSRRETLVAKAEREAYRERCKVERDALRREQEERRGKSLEVIVKARSDAQRFDLAVRRDETLNRFAMIGLTIAVVIAASAGWWVGSVTDIETAAKTPTPKSSAVGVGGW